VPGDVRRNRRPSLYDLSGKETLVIAFLCLPVLAFSTEGGAFPPALLAYLILAWLFYAGWLLLSRTNLKPVRGLAIVPMTFIVGTRVGFFSMLFMIVRYFAKLPF
jgi:hypothetical protein